MGPDATAYRKLVAPLVADRDKVAQDVLGPLPIPPHHPLALAHFGLQAVRSAAGLARSQFQGEAAPALWAGMAGHSMLPLEDSPRAAFGLMLAVTGHAVGWPVVPGGLTKHRPGAGRPS